MGEFLILAGGLINNWSGKWLPMNGKMTSQARTFCALGAQQTVMAINGAIPILYAGRTCTYRLYQGMSDCNGHQGIGNHGGSSVICTGMHNIPLPDVKTTDTLAKAIETARKIMDADLYVVLSGCLPELIGDDTGSIVRRYRSQGMPLVYAEAAGFKGNAYLGHEWVTRAIVDQLVPPKKIVEPHLVNLWSSVPYLDPFWSGNLMVLKQLLEQIGLKVNLLFGVDSSVQSWRRISSAAVNLVVSPWVGLDLVRHLKERFGTPYLHYPVLPIGAYETSKFLKWIAQELRLDMMKVRALIAQQEREFYYYLERAAELFVGYRQSFPERFFMIADSSYVLAVTKFLVNEIGLLPGCQYIVDVPPQRYRAEISRQLNPVAEKIVAEVDFVDGSLELQEMIKEKLAGHIPLILGSSWDADIVNELGGCYLGISAPLSDRLILNRSYLGYDGGLLLLEEIYSRMLEQCG
jgi:nitrogenase molybdenum-iron protein beta chain